MGDFPTPDTHVMRRFLEFESLGGELGLSRLLVHP